MPEDGGQGQVHHRHREGRQLHAGLGQCFLLDLLSQNEHARELPAVKQGGKAHGQQQPEHKQGAQNDEGLTLGRLHAHGLQHHRQRWFLALHGQCCAQHHAQRKQGYQAESQYKADHGHRAHNAQHQKAEEEQ
ncbi:hypothetical protein D3C72_1868840 [compost metagenome]